MDDKAQNIIQQIIEKKTRAQIIEFINGYGDPIDWENWTVQEILDEVYRSDCEAGEKDSGILTAMEMEWL